MSSNEWLYIEHQPSSGKFNMGFDEKMVAFYQEKGQPVFRIYGWNPPAISIGRFQEWTFSDSYVPVVRRQTGGGAIYHHQELTYSLVCSPHDIGLGIQVKEGYRRLTGFLIDFYKTLGLEADYAQNIKKNAKLNQKTLACYKGTEQMDILISSKDGSSRKIGGNAQMRKRNLIFQHGSIPLGIDWEQWSKVFPKNTLPSIDQITCLSQWLNKSYSREKLTQLLKDSFAGSLNKKLVSKSTLTQF